MVVCESGEIAPEHLRIPKPLTASKSLATLDELEREHIRAALDATNGNRAQTARTLGISERNLYRKLKDHRLDS
jgi:DNA-binding NtrC family response regulator